MRSGGTNAPGDVPVGPWDDVQFGRDGAGGYFAFRPNEVIVEADDDPNILSDLFGLDAVTLGATPIIGRLKLVHNIDQSTAAFNRQAGPAPFAATAQLQDQGFKASPNHVFFGTSMYGPTGALPEIRAPRTSSVLPAPCPIGSDTVLVGRTPPGAPCRVLVLDTGFAGDAQRIGPNDRMRAACLAGVVRSIDDFEVPDADNNAVLDPFAGHGTFIAGLYGRLAPGAEITVKKVMHPYGDTDDAAVATALNDALALDPKDGTDTPDPPFHVISMSFCGYANRDDPPIALAEAVRFAHAKYRDPASGKSTIVIVASAGNDASCRLTWPGAFENVISVGAIGPNGPAWFTNYGPWVNACAPGVDIVSTFFGYPPGTQDLPPVTDQFQGWARWSGTSFSAPIVGAVIASKWMAAVDDAGNPPISEVASHLIDRPGLFRYPQLGTVINVQ